MTKQITIKHKESVVLATRGEEIDVENWISVFKTISVNRMADEVVIRVTDSDEEYARARELRMGIPA